MSAPEREAMSKPVARDPRTIHPPPISKPQLWVCRLKDTQWPRIVIDGKKVRRAE